MKLHNYVLIVIMMYSCSLSESKLNSDLKSHAISMDNQMEEITRILSYPSYQNRLGEISNIPSEEGLILFLGNSITQAGKWSEILKGHKSINQGINGDITFGVYKRLFEAVRHKPSKIFLMIGVNDLFMGIQEETIVKNIFVIINTLNSQLPETKIILQSVLPINLGMINTEVSHSIPDRIKYVNTELEKNQFGLSFHFVNLYDSFINAEGALDENYSYDGIHLNSRGYNLWVDNLKSEGLVN